MIRSILLTLILVTLPVFAHAQEGTPGAEHKWSVGTGLGFASSIGAGRLSQSGFNWQLDGQYRITDSFSAGMMMQVIPVTGATVFSMTWDGRYHLGMLTDNSNDIVSKIVPFAGAGIGFTHVGFTSAPGVPSVGANAFLFSMILGTDYNFTEHIAATSEMRFNITGGFPTVAGVAQEHFYFSWQIVGIRYRF